MEARKRKMEERRIGVGRRDERGKRTERTRDGMLENAHANGKGFTAKVSRGNEQNVRTNEQTDSSIDRSGTGGLVHLLFSLCLLLSPARGTVLLGGSLKLQLERRTRCSGSSSTVSESRVNE